MTRLKINTFKNIASELDDLKSMPPAQSETYDNYINRELLLIKEKIEQKRKEEHILYKKQMEQVDILVEQLFEIKRMNCKNELELAKYLLEKRNYEDRFMTPNSSGAILAKKVEEALKRPMEFPKALKLLLEGSCTIYKSISRNERCHRFQADCTKCMTVFFNSDKSDTKY